MPGRLASQGEPEDDRGADTGCRADAHDPTVKPDQRLGDSQAQTGAVLGLGELAFNLLERTAEPRQGPGRDADARIGDDGVPIHIVPTTAVAAKNVIARSDAGDVQGNATVYPSPYGSALLTDHGGSQIPKLARNLGQAQKEFKKGIAEASKDDDTPAPKAD